MDAEPPDAEPMDEEPLDVEPPDAEPMDEEPLDAESLDASSAPGGMEEPAPESTMEPARDTEEETMDGEGEIMELKDPIVLEDPPPGRVEEAVELEGALLEEAAPARSTETEAIEVTEATEDTKDTEDTAGALTQLRRILEDVQAKLAKTEAAQVETQHALTEAWAKVAQLESEQK